MRHPILYFLLALCFIAFSCEKELQHSKVDGDTNGPFTLVLDSTTATTASFAGSIDLKKYAGYEHVGIIYSLDEVLDSQIDTNNMVPITIIDKNCDFNKKVKYLLHDTTYYYTSYVHLSNGLYQLGNVKSFKTASVNFLKPSVATTSTTATFSGKINLSNDDLDALDFGLLISTDSDLEDMVDNYRLSVSEDGRYSITIYNLTIGTEYHYALYARSGSHITYGAAEKFVTDRPGMTSFASNVSYSSAEIYGKVSVLDEDRNQYIEYGILVSPYQNLSIESSSCQRISVNSDMDVNGEYSVTLNGLEGATKYYFCTYILQGNVCYYGSVGNFTTKSVSLSFLSPVVSQTRFVISGTYPSHLSDAEIYFEYAESEEILLDEYSYNKNTVRALKDNTSRSFSAEISGLTFNTTYYYRYRVYTDGRYHYGQTRTFTTNNVQVSLYADKASDYQIHFSGSVDIEEDGAIVVGVEYYPQGYEYYYGVSSAELTNCGGDFSRLVSVPYSGVEYLCRYYIRQGSKCQYGDYFSVSLR